MTKLPESYCAVEVTYRSIQDSKLIEETICIESSLEQEVKNGL